MSSSAGNDARAPILAHSPSRPAAPRRAAERRLKRSGASRVRQQPCGRGGCRSGSDGHVFVSVSSPERRPQETRQTRRERAFAFPSHLCRSTASASPPANRTERPVRKEKKCVNARQQRFTRPRPPVLPPAHLMEDDCPGAPEPGEHADNVCAARRERSEHDVRVVAVERDVKAPEELACDEGWRATRHQYIIDMTYCIRSRDVPLYARTFPRSS